MSGRDVPNREVVVGGAWGTIHIGRKTNSNTAYGLSAIAIGNEITVNNGAYSISIGHQASGGWNSNGIAVGTSTSASGDSVSLGHGAIANNSNCVAIGTNAEVSGGDGVSIGYNSEAGTSTVSVGTSAGAAISSGTHNAFMGYYGGGGVTNGGYNVHVGSYAGYGSSGPGTNKTTTATGQVIVGYDAAQGSTTQMNNIVLIGRGASATGAAGIAIGYQTVAHTDSVAIGDAYTSAANTISIGKQTQVTVAGGVAIGCDNGGTGAQSTSSVNEFVLGTTLHTIKTQGGRRKAYAAKTTTYAAAKTDHIINCTSGTFNVTLPTAVSDTGREFIIKNSGAGTITVDTTSSQTIDGGSSVALAQYESVTVISDGANWIVV